MHERLFDPGETFIGIAVISVPQTTQLDASYPVRKSQGCGWGQIKPSLPSMSQRGGTKYKAATAQLNKAADQSYFYHLCHIKSF